MMQSAISTIQALSLWIHRIDAKCKNFGQNIDNTFDIVVLNNKYGYNRK